MQTRAVARWAGAFVMLVMLAPSAASAGPAGCNIVTASAKVTNLGTLYRNGDDIPLVVTYRNDGSNTCDVTDAKIVLTPPDRTGGMGQPMTVAEHLSIPAGTPPTALPAVHFTPDFNVGVSAGDVHMLLSGTTHYPDHDVTSDISSGGGGTLKITDPVASMDVTASPANGPAPLATTYTYAVRNRTAQSPTAVAFTDVSVKDEGCSPVTYASGDDGDTTLEGTETWIYTCAATLPTTGVFTDHATVTGTSSADGRPVPAATGSAAVVVLGPDLTVAESHRDAFLQGDTARHYTIVAANSGTAPTTGTVTVTDTLPAGLTGTAISGDGWTCDAAALRCTRGDALAPGASYPALTLTVNVAADAPALLTNAAAVAGGGETRTDNDTATDPTNVDPARGAAVPARGVAAPAPAPSCTLRAARKLTADHRLRATLRCTRLVSATLTGSARIGKRRVKLPRRHLTLLARHRTVVSIRLSRSVVRAKRVVYLSLTLAAADSDGTAARSVKTTTKLAARRG
ncbi:MAG: hypothetical protein JWQ18_2432 [Conexibacter sp.]|nr:hypothetical protein [Conexibacter sp.]